MRSEDATPVAIVLPPGYVRPSSTEYSSFTFPNVPVRVHVTAWELPMSHSSVPFGEVTVREPLILK